MPKQIRIAPNLTLPIDIAVEKMALLGKSGRGKTYAAKKIVEEVMRAGVPVAIIDPTDVWYGLSSGSDGTERGGMDVVIFGGRHGDLPLNEHIGKMLARLVLQGNSIIIAGKRLPKAARRRLVADFLTELYDLAEENPVLVVVDEADEYAPQNTFGQVEVAKCLGALEDVVRRGRAGGLGSLLISQRPAVLNKDVLEQVDVLICLGMTGKNDIGAIDVWVGRHANSEDADKIKPSLPELPKGTAWVWAPEMGLLKKVEISPITTFDSSRTPKVGEKPLAVISRKALDLDLLGTEIAQFEKEVQDNDPKALKKRVVDLERQLSLRDQANVSQSQRLTEYEQHLEDAGREAGSLHAQLEEARAGTRPSEFPPQVTHAISQVLKALEEATSDTALALKLIDEHDSEVVEKAKGALAISASVPVKAIRSAPIAPQKPAPVRQRPAAAPAGVGEGIALPKVERTVLSVLAAYAPAPRSAKQVALIGQYSSKGGGFRNALGALRSKGFINGTNNSMAITEEGLAALGSYEPLPTGSALVEHWCNSSVLGRAEASSLRAIVAAYPNEISSVEVAEQAGYEPGGGGFRNALGKLRSLELIVGGNAAMRASEELID